VIYAQPRAFTDPQRDALMDLSILVVTALQGRLALLISGGW
jgi:hypothetical protein